LKGLLLIVIARNILAMVVKSKNQLALIPIKTYIKRQIEGELRNADEEKKEKFTNSRYLH